MNKTDFFESVILKLQNLTEEKATEMQNNQ